MRSLKTSFKLVSASLLLMLLVACTLFTSNISGIWVVTGAGSDAKMQLQQSGSQVVGYAYFQGQLDGQVYGQVSGQNVVLQIRRAYQQGIISYKGQVSSDGMAMNLQSTNGASITMFKQ